MNDKNSSPDETEDDFIILGRDSSPDDGNMIMREAELDTVFEAIEDFFGSTDNIGEADWILPNG